MKIKEEVLKNKTDIIIVSLITIIAIVLRIITVKNYGSIWMDELYSWDFSNQDSIFKTIVISAKEDVHLPFYFILLHFWIKLFGDNSECMRYCTLLFSIPLIPAIYIVGKNIFNKTTGYIACIFVTLSTFCVYYCTEIRFYGIIFVLALLSNYFHTKITENFNSKDEKLYIVFQTIYNYTFPLAVLFFIIQALTGAFYSIKQNSDNFFKLLKTYAYTFLFSIGGFAFVGYNVIKLNSNIFSFQKNNFDFSFKIIYDIIENFFTSSNYIIISQDFNTYKNFSDYISSARTIFLVLIPMIIGLCFLIRGMITKEKKANLFLIPTYIFVILIFILGSLSLVSVQTRYLCMIYPIVILCMCFGFSLLKNKILSFVFFFLLLQLNFLFLITEERTIFNLHRQDNNMVGYCARDVWDIKDDDLIISPCSGRKMYYYIKKGKFIDFSIDEALLLKNKKSGLFYFGEDYYNLNKNNIRDYLMYNGLNDIPEKAYEDNLVEIFNTMKKGQRLFVYIFFENLLTTPREEGIDEYNYNEVDMLPFTIGKALRDTLIIADKHLKYLGNVDDYCRLRVYEKQ